MKYFIGFIKISFFLFFLIVLNFLALYSLPYPISQTNILLAGLLLFLFINESGSVVWLAFFLHLLVEPYSISPYGIILFSGTIALLIAYWGYKYLFSNKSLFTVIALSIISISIYRLIYLFLLVFIRLTSSEGTNILFSSVIISYLWETIFTSIVVALLYIFIIKVVKPVFMNNYE